jgi:putative iron-regulated protein
LTICIFVKNKNQIKIFTMKKVFFKGAILASIFGVILSCSDDDSSSTPTPTPTIVTAADVVENYANLVAENYLETYNKGLILQTKINDFVATPTDATLLDAKNAWLAARVPYGQTEVYRETNSPVDVEFSTENPWGLGTEGQMNAWPCDEGYIDYITASSSAYAGSLDGGIIAGSDQINTTLLVNANEAGSDKNISTGWHAIEFLLWGQDESAPINDTAGQRPVTDYTTEANASRRKEYLTVVTNLLILDLLDLKNTWAVGGEYRTLFDALDVNVALSQLVFGAKFIAGEELSTERMVAPVDSIEGINNSGQEMEHSCFSDNTHNDIYDNTVGVLNVVYGRYGSLNGASFYDLVLQQSPTRAAALDAAANVVETKILAIKNNSKPFDLLIVEENTTSPGPVMDGVQALYDLANEISASADAIGLELD